MCTLSWCHERPDGGYRLLFNRDEQKTREPADPPTLSQRDGVPYLAPRDPRAGGTWMLVNAHGVTIALLNHYAADAPANRPAKPTSRGQLVLEFAACPDVATFRAHVPVRQAAGRYPPFLLFATDPAGGESLWRWDGDALEEIDIPDQRFLTTSSFRSAEVLAARAETRARFAADLHGFHAQHDPERPEFSVRMRRPDAQTVSFNEIDVTPESVRFRYRPEGIDSLEDLPALERTLARGL